MIWYPQDLDELWVAYDEAIERGGSVASGPPLPPRWYRINRERSRAECPAPQFGHVIGIWSKVRQHACSKAWRDPSTRSEPRQ